MAVVIDSFGCFHSPLHGRRLHLEAAQGWSGPNPFGLPFFIVVHRPSTLPQTPGSGS
jgi:hypothetical protein